MTELDELERSGRHSNRNRAAIGILLLLAIVVSAIMLPLREWLDVASAWIDVNPLSGRLIFIAAFIALTILMVPGSILMLSGGYLFGLGIGLPLVSVGIALGAGAASFVSRTIARDWLAQHFAGDARFQAIDRAVAKKGFLIVLLSRLSLLIPFNLLNLIYGLSGISLIRMILATWVGMTPAVILYTYLGSIAGSLDELFSSDTQNDLLGKTILVSGLVMVGIVTFVVHRTATRELKRELEAND